MKPLFFGGEKKVVTVHLQRRQVKPVLISLLNSWRMLHGIQDFSLLPSWCVLGPPYLKLPKAVKQSSLPVVLFVCN